MSEEDCKIKRIYDKYSEHEKRHYAEDCAFKATCQVVSDSLFGHNDVRANIIKNPYGDEHAAFSKCRNEWIVQRFLRKEGDFPSIAIYLNDKLNAAITVVNREPHQYWNFEQIAYQVELRFLRVPVSVPTILLTTNNNFSKRQRIYLTEVSKMHIGKVHSSPLPEFDLQRSVTEMRHILQELITPDHLTDQAYDIENCWNQLTQQDKRNKQLGLEHPTFLTLLWLIDRLSGKPHQLMPSSPQREVAIWPMGVKLTYHKLNNKKRSKGTHTPDFEITRYHRTLLAVECKNVRNTRKVNPKWLKTEVLSRFEKGEYKKCPKVVIFSYFVPEPSHRNELYSMLEREGITIIKLGEQPRLRDSEDVTVKLMNILPSHLSKPLKSLQDLRGEP